MAVALSRFGTFSGLHLIHSGPNDTPTSIPTLTFYWSGYTSSHVAFTPVEMQKIGGSPLQTPTAAHNAILSKYDAPPYVVGTAGLAAFPAFETLLEASAAASRQISVPNRRCY